MHDEEGQAAVLEKGLDVKAPCVAKGALGGVERRPQGLFELCGKPEAGGAGSSRSGAFCSLISSSSTGAYRCLGLDVWNVLGPSEAAQPVGGGQAELAAV